MEDTPGIDARFPRPTAEDWRRAAEATLKGRPLAKLTRKTPDGVAVEPLSLDGPARPAVAGLADGRRGWEIRARVLVHDAAAARAQVEAERARGAQGLWLVPTGDAGSAASIAGEWDGPWVLDGATAPVAGAGVLYPADGVDAAPWLANGALADGARVGVSAMDVEGRGASAAQSLAVLVRRAVELLRRAGGDAAALAPGLLAPRLEVRLGVGTEVFAEIAKLRALRVVWARVLGAAGLPATRLAVHAVTSPVQMSRRDPWTNLLRTTAQGFAAAVGGADAISLLPFDDALGQPSDQGLRLATTFQAVLAEEGALGEVADPAGGSYTIETLTDGIARAAWAILRELERTGADAPDDAIAATAAARAATLAKRRRTLVGVSEFALADEAALDRAAGGVEAPAFREAGAWEALRDAVEATEPRPTVHLVNLGPLPEHSARAGFARRWAEAAGFAVTESEGADDAAAAAADFAASGAHIAVICGADVRYAEMMESVARAVVGHGPRAVIVAGRPGDHEGTWRAAGVTHAIFMGADVLETGVAVARACGVEV